MSIRPGLARSMLTAVLACALAVPLSACGKKGTLEPPEDEVITYPRTYPVRCVPVRLTHTPTRDRLCAYNG